MELNDLYHYWGNDLSAAANGDVLGVTGTVRGQQRVLRRLLSNPGDLVFHPEYGAGLPAKVGTTARPDEITALIRGQMLLEDCVAKLPAPIIVVTAITNGIAAQINYTDAQSGTPVTLSFNVSQ